MLLRVDSSQSDKRLVALPHVNFSRGRIEFRGRLIAVSDKQALMMDALVGAYPSPVDRDGLVFAMYGDRDDAPSGKTLEVHLQRLRGRLSKAGVGLQILNNRHAGWHLVVEAPA